MGGGSSKIDASSHALDKTESEIVRLMMPVYYIDEPITNEELEAVTSTWKMILTNSSPEFLAKRLDPTFPYPTCIMYFYSSFYDRLFDVHPMARILFRDMSSQGKFLVKMISLSLSEKADPEKYDKTLRKLAEIHCDRGVKAVECKPLVASPLASHWPLFPVTYPVSRSLSVADGLVGEVLFWAIKQSIGRELYTPEVHRAWVKVYSRMLTTMLPVAVLYEIKHKEDVPHRPLSIPLMAASSDSAQDFPQPTRRSITAEESTRLNDTLQAVLRTVSEPQSR